MLTKDSFRLLQIAILYAIPYKILTVKSYGQKRTIRAFNYKTMENLKPYLQNQILKRIC